MKIFITHSHCLRKKLFVMYRFASIVTNNDVCTDPEIEEALKKGVFAHQKHPGIMTNKISLPQRLESAIDMQIKTCPPAALKTASRRILNYLWQRPAPPECSVEQDGQLPEDDKVMNKLDADHWRQVLYQGIECYAYLSGRMSFEYSALYRLMDEIRKRDPEFKPQTLLDFGSGLGSSIWAANNVWEDSLSEHVCIDISPDMNKISRFLLQDGDENKPTMCYKNVYFRRHLQKSKNQYDVVTCAFSLMDLPSKAARRKTILELWKKTRNYLIIIENGTYNGFDLTDEARNTILKLQNDGNVKRDKDVGGHVFAPCPHDLPCPKASSYDKERLCSFQLRHKSCDVLVKKGPRDLTQGRYSCVVFKKGKRSAIDPSWPRVLSKTTNNKLVRLYNCSHSGNVEVTVITRNKHGTDLLMCAKSCSEGDLLPVLGTVDYQRTCHRTANEAATCYNVKQDYQESCRGVNLCMDENHADGSDSGTR